MKSYKLIIGLLIVGILFSMGLVWYLPKTKKLSFKMIPPQQTGERSNTLGLKFREKNKRVVAQTKQAELYVVFDIVNESTKPITLFEATTTCGCSVASIQPEVVHPNGTSQIKVKGIPPATGEKTVYIYIKSNDPLMPVTRLSLVMVGWGKPPYIANAPESIGFGRLAGVGQVENFVFTTKEALGSEPWINSISGPSGNINFKIDRTLSEQMDGVILRKYFVSAHIAKSFPEGEFRDSADLKTDITAAETIHSITIHGLVQPKVSTVPSSLFTSAGKGERADPLYFSVVFQDKKNHRLHYENSLPAGFDVTQVNSSVSGLHRYRLIILKPIESLIKSSIIFTIDGSSENRLEVPLLINCNEVN